MAYDFIINLRGSFVDKFAQFQRNSIAGLGSITKSVDELQRELDSLQAARRLMVDKHQIAAANNEIARLKKQMGDLDNLGKSRTLADLFKNAVGNTSILGTNLSLLANPVMAVTAGIGGIGAAFADGITKAAMISDKLADVRKTTDMTEDAAASLQRQLQNLGSRTSLAELLDISKIGGQMGIQSDELLEFTKAINMANVALGDEFQGGVEGVARNLGILRDLFADTKTMAYGDAMSKIGSAINHLGSMSKATGGEMSNFAARMGQLGTLAPNITDTLALGATMQSLGLTSEIASSGLSKIISQSAAELPKFAKWLGISESEMKRMIDTDPTQVLLSFANSLKGLSNTQIIEVMDNLKIGTDEAKKSIMALAGNTDMFTKLQAEAATAFKDNTSLVDEYNIKNETLAARLDKAKNSLFNMSLALGRLIAPAVAKVADGIAALVGDGQQLIDMLKGAAVGAGIGAAAYATYTVATSGIASVLKAAQAAQWALNLAMSLNPVGLVIAGFAALGAGVAWAYNEFAEFRGIIWGVWEALRTLYDKAVLTGKTIASVFKGDFAAAMDFEQQAAKIDIGGAFQKAYDAQVAAEIKTDMQQQATAGKQKTDLVALAKSLQLPAAANSDANPSAGLEQLKFENKFKSAAGSAVGSEAGTTGGVKHITVNVQKLVETLTISTTNLTESTAQVRDEIARALLGALNDVNYS